MLVKKTFKFKIINPTKTKLKILEQEYEKLNLFLKTGIDLGVYSANKQQALRFYKKVIQEKEYPLSIRKDLLKFSDKGTFVRIPVKDRKGGIWLPIKAYQPISNFEICESKILRKGNIFFIHITAQKKIEPERTYSSILAIDLGEKVIATTVLSSMQRPKFYGTEIRGIRRHYAWLRKRLGKKKLLKKINTMGDKEKRTVNDILHKISKEIVEHAKKNNSIIVLGNLKGIRKNSKGKRFNRIVNSMPFHKLTRYVVYKANWEGIKVVKVDEKGTSHTCSKCGAIGKRSVQGLFKCQCGYQVNADFNGAKNILNRSREYISRDGAVVNQPLTMVSSIETVQFKEQ